MIWFWLVGTVMVMFGLTVFRGAPYVPSQKRYVRQAFDKLYPLTEKDVLVDIGSGDGIVLRLASERQAKAIGYEINPLLAMISRLLSLGDKRIQIRLADFWLTPLPGTVTVVYAFMASRYVKKVTAKMQHEATRLGRPLSFIIYGNELTDRKPNKVLGAHHLYIFTPLQIDEA
jgi:hypothetical protein